jgi:transposase
VAFKEVNDAVWEIIALFLSQKAKTGRPRSSLRSSFNGMLYVLIAGVTWMDVHRMCGIFRFFLRGYRDG